MYTDVVIVVVVVVAATLGNWNRVLCADNFVFMVTIVFEYYGPLTHWASPVPILAPVVFIAHQPVRHINGHKNVQRCVYGAFRKQRPDDKPLVLARLFILLCSFFFVFTSVPHMSPVPVVSTFMPRTVAAEMC